MANPLVQRIVAAIETDYAHAVTLRRLAASVGRQPAYLGRLFRQETGSSVRDYLTRVRLEHATTLIHEGVKIEAVALSVGYRSKKNFYQQFKRRYGTTPIPYREHLEPAGSASAPRRDAALPDAMATVSDEPGHSDSQADSDESTEPEPVLAQLSMLVHASSHAWSLAVRMQRILASRFRESHVPMLLTGDDGRYVAANTAAVSLTGYSVPELRVLEPAALFSFAPLADTRCSWQLILSTVHARNLTANAVLRSKRGDLVRVHVVTLKNWLWGSPDMSGIVGALPRPPA